MISSFEVDAKKRDGEQKYDWRRLILAVFPDLVRIITLHVAPRNLSKIEAGVIVIAVPETKFLLRRTRPVAFKIIVQQHKKATMDINA
jgi:hypothetical protein